MKVEILGSYKNGNILTTIFSDGTLIRETKDDEFRPAFASNMDIKICNCCDRKCPWCHEGSTPDGKLGDILNEKFIDTLHPYQEVALGGGNVLEHPDLVPFLLKLKDRKVITNITLNQYHFESNIDLIRSFIDSKLIYGLGISLMNPTKEFINIVRTIPNAVIHVINGVVNPYDISLLSNNHLKLLILGYKNLRRGKNHFQIHHTSIQNKMQWINDHIQDLINEFDVISFDNLAIDQLHIKEQWHKLSEQPWDEFYAGDDGTNTFYIDMVERQFAKSSTEDFDKRYNLLDNVDDMFEVIRNETNRIN